MQTRFGADAQAPPAIFILIATLLFLQSPAELMAGDVSIGGELGLGIEGYESGYVQETVLARDLTGSLFWNQNATERGNLTLSSHEDLHDLRRSLHLGYLHSGAEVDLGLDIRFAQNHPGPLQRESTFFDPESLLVSLESSLAHEQSEIAMDIQHHGPFMDWRLALLWNRIGYYEPSEYLSDRESIRISAESDFLLPLGLDLDLRLSAEQMRFSQRPGSGSGEGEVDLRLGRALGDAWDLALHGDLLNRSVDNQADLQTYEHPAGRQWAAGLTVDYFGESLREFGLSLGSGYEDWQGYDGFYRSGRTSDLELVFSWPLATAHRFDLLLSGMAFKPDSAVADSWTSRRSGENLLNGECFLSFFEDRPAGFSLGLGGEELRVDGSEGTDRFRLLQAEIGLSWRPGSGHSLNASLDLNRYLSEYPDADSEQDEGFGGTLGYSRQWGEWKLAVDLSSSRSYSFWEEATTVDDWRVAISALKQP